MRINVDKQFNKELTALAIPFALQGLLNALVGASDALMLGRLTQESIAAVSLANQVSFVMSLFISAVVGAVGVLVAQYYGKGDYECVKKLLCMSIRYVFVITLVFFALAFLAPEQLMRIFTDEAALIHIGAGYLRIVSFSYLFLGLTQCYLMLMKIDGRAKMSVWISAVTVIVDMVMDFFLIYGFGKIPALGANGSAYSTIAVEVIAFVWCVAASFEKGRIHPDGKSMLYFSKQLEKDMLIVALPMLASCLSWGLSISVHSVIIGHLGTDATAAYSVTNVATGLIQCLSHGFASGAGVMIGGLLGRNLLEKSKDYDMLFVDIYHNEIDGLKTYAILEKRAKKIKLPFKINYWIENAILTSLRRYVIDTLYCHMEGIEMEKDEYVIAVEEALEDMEFVSFSQIENLITDEGLKEFAAKLNLNA